MMLAVLTATAAPPHCVHASLAGGGAGARELWFDTHWRPIAVTDLDDRGHRIGHTDLTWTDASIAVVQDPTASAFVAPEARGELGAHGELLRWSDGLHDVRFAWDGTFADAEPREALEEGYLGLDVLVPLRTADRTLFTRMGAFSFTGTLTVSGTHPATARYDAGRLVEHAVGDPNSPSVTRYEWSGDDLVAVSAPGVTITVSSDGGHLTSWREQRPDGSRTDVVLERRGGAFVGKRESFEASGDGVHRRRLVAKPCSGAASR